MFSELSSNCSFGVRIGVCTFWNIEPGSQGATMYVGCWKISTLVNFEGTLISWNTGPGCHYKYWLQVNSHLICESGEIGNFPTQLSRSKGYENIGKLPPQALSAVDWPSEVVFVSLLNRSPPPRRFNCNSLVTKWYNDRINRWGDIQCGGIVWDDLKNEKGELSQYFVWVLMPSSSTIQQFTALVPSCRPYKG